MKFVVTYYYSATDQDFEEVFNSLEEAENFIHEQLDEADGVSEIEIHTSEEYEQYLRIKELEKNIDVPDIND